MAVSRKNIKGVANIRTHSGPVDRTLKPHEAHMRLCVLEMEKARRGQERESALKRVHIIDARNMEIEQEKQDILQALELNTGESLKTGRKHSPQKFSEESQPVKGFSLKY